MLEYKFEDSIWKVIVCFCMFTIGTFFLIFPLLPLNVNLRLPICIPCISSGIMILCVCYGVWALNKRTYDKTGQMISSRATVFFKFYIPLFLVTCFILDTTVMIAGWYYPGDFIYFMAADIVLLLLGGLALRLRRLNSVWVVGNFVIISDFFKNETFSLLSVMELKRNFSGIYHIRVDRYLVNTDYLFIPHIGDVFGKLFWMIQVSEIEKFRRKLRGYQMQ